MTTTIPSIKQLSKLLKGYSNRLDTPFGEVASLHCNGYFTGRPLELIQNIINKFIRPFIASDPYSETYNSGCFSNNLHSASESIILECLDASINTHSVYPCGQGELAAFQKVARLLKLGALARRAKLMGSTDDMPVVYVSSIETYQNLLPWFVSGCRLVGIDIDDQGNLKADSLAKAFAQNSTC